MEVSVRYVNFLKYQTVVFTTKNLCKNSSNVFAKKYTNDLIRKQVKKFDQNLLSNKQKTRITQEKKNDKNDVAHGN